MIPTHITATLALAALLLTACATTPPPGEQPLAPASYDTYSRSDNNRVVVHGHTELTKIEVYSHKGIGSAVVTLTEGDWPRAAVVRLHTRFLERFVIETSDDATGGKMTTGAFVRSSGNHAVHQDPARSPDDPLYLPIKIVDFRTAAAKPKLPIQNAKGYFEITVPPAMLRSGAKFIKVSWVDVYRN